jgi:hypothetical protein
MALAKSVGENLLREEVLMGEDNILQYMIENNMLERYYTEAIGCPLLNHVGTGLMTQLCHKHPRMNILEVGAGKSYSIIHLLFKSMTAEIKLFKEPFRYNHWCLCLSELLPQLQSSLCLYLFKYANKPRDWFLHSIYPWPYW